MKKKYPSKIDLWVGVLLIGGLLVISFSVLTVLISESAWWSKLLQAGIGLAINVFVISILINTNYSVAEQSILARTGPFKWTIPIEKIDSIVPAKNFWSSAALSADRLYIEYDEGTSKIYISPKDKSGFMRDVAGRSSELIYELDKVVRAGE